ncbi:hypothetical protein [Jejuia spongiicola]|uniref:Uncharacterized protein n=1 Tax=Jejuia spongiicola TaxID=2942207 RepID=A0ABT0QJT6_9FLAO|nr:hypothetical protein [Jejuia spongiicola]MCL6296245.1 hypothetical protein [Jejuia spongiicola]
MTSLINDFEDDFLQKEYPDLSVEDAYIEFLIQVDDDMSGDWMKPSQDKRKVLDKNNFKFELYQIADSVWIEKNPDALFKLEKSIVKTRWKYLNEKGIFEFNFSESTIAFFEPKNEDSLIKLRKKYIDINYTGKYRKALRAISKENQFIQEYLNMTDAAGNLDPRLIAGKMLFKKVDVSDYFIKRLIITEIIY